MSKVDKWLVRSTLLNCILVLLVQLANGVYDLALNYSLTNCTFG
ncbi:hypothetical protein [Pseudomonas sp. SIMBA_041]